MHSRAFADETGNSPNDFAFNLAAWVGTVEDWDRFSDDWERELRNPPAIGYFKHHEAVGDPPTGEFECWPSAECSKKMVSLANVIVGYKDLYGVISGMRHAVINDLLAKSILPPGKRKQIAKMFRPYQWCFHDLVIGILSKQFELGRTEPTDFIFDDGDGAFKQCRRRYEIIKRDMEPEFRRLAGVASTGDDKLIMPLQAADLLAGQVTTRLRDQPTGEAYRVLYKHKSDRLFVNVIKNDHPFIEATRKLIEKSNILEASNRLDKAAGKKNET